MALFGTFLIFKNLLMIKKKQKKTDVSLFFTPEEYDIEHPRSNHLDKNIRKTRKYTEVKFWTINEIFRYLITVER